MKPSVAVALVICGTILIIAPYVSNAIGTAQVSELMNQLQRDVNLRGDMPHWYDMACFAGGIVMVAVGVVASVQREAA